MTKLKQILKTTKPYRMLRLVKDTLVYSKLIVAALIFSFLKVKKKKIVFSSFYGGQYSAQPKNICDYLSKLGGDIEIVWLLSENYQGEFPENFRRVKPNTLRAIYELKTAGVWIDNCRKPAWLIKRKEQFYIQTWHGPVCIKAVEKDAGDALDLFYIESAKRDSKNANFIVAESVWRENNIKKAFWYDGELIRGEFKSIRSQGNEEISKKVKKEYNLSDNCKIVLYVPTFRNDGRTDCYNIDFKRLLDFLEQQTGEEYVVVLRLHPNIANQQSELKYTNRILNGTTYNSVQELIIASDVVISDYSGCIFSGFREEKLVIIYASDLEKYLQEERALYFDFQRLPAPFAANNDQLIEQLKSIDMRLYHKKREEFVRELGYYEADAAKLCVEEIAKYLY